MRQDNPDQPADRPGDQSAAAAAPDTSEVPRSTAFQAPGKPLPMARRLAIHNTVVRTIRSLLYEQQFVEMPVPELTGVTGSCEVVDSTFSLDYFGTLAFPRQTGQLYLEEAIANGFDAVYCEGESVRKEWKVDERHLTEFKLIEAEKRDLTLDELLDLQEQLLKAIAAELGVELLGGANVTRLDRMIQQEHPRLTYREALDVLNARGWSMPFGEDFHRDAEATLSRYCGNLPVQVTHFPESLEFFNAKLDRADPSVVENVDYILPLAGETMSGAVHEPDSERLQRRLHESSLYSQLLTHAREFARVQIAASPDRQADDFEGLAARYQRGIQASLTAYLERFRAQEIRRAGFGLGVARLLQYFMGLESIKDAVVFPMDRTTYQTHGTDRSTSQQSTGSDTA